MSCVWSLRAWLAGSPLLCIMCMVPLFLASLPHAHTYTHTCTHTHTPHCTQSWFEASNRGAIHASMLVLYAWGGYLVTQGLMPIGVLVSGIGFTYSLMYSAQVGSDLVMHAYRCGGVYGYVAVGMRVHVWHVVRGCVAVVLLC